MAFQNVYAKCHQYAGVCDLTGPIYLYRKVQFLKFEFLISDFEYASLETAFPSHEL